MARSACLDQGLARSFRQSLSSAYKRGVSAEYVWIGGSRDTQDLRSKTRIIYGKVPPSCVDELPVWNYDGSSTAQATGSDSEVILLPRAIFKDPFRGGENILVMCDTHVPAAPEVGREFTEPHESNTRVHAASIMEKVEKEKPWFGLEQEYTLLGPTKWPLGWPQGGFPNPQGPYYCGVGAGCAIARDVMETHLLACLYAGITVSGANGEVMPGQWEYQVGPCEGIDIGDHLWMARYIMLRVCEMFDCHVTLDPKPIPGDWNGTGCHVNFSNNATRAKGSGWDAIKTQVARLEAHHKEDIALYGAGNERRMTGQHETAQYGAFTWGVADRGASVRVPRSVPIEKEGYFEDRRPASNMDPYVVCARICETALLDNC